LNEHPRGKKKEKWLNDNPLEKYVAGWGRKALPTIESVWRLEVKRKIKKMKIRISFHFPRV